MNKMTIKNRRKADRINMPLKIKQRLFRSKELIRASVKDVSGGGLRIDLPKRLKKGDRLQILLYFPNDSKPVTIFGEVVWCKETPTGCEKPFEIGVKYINIAPEDKERFVFLLCEHAI